MPPVTLTVNYDMPPVIVGFAKTIQHTFLIENRFDVPLEFKQVRTSCSCQGDTRLDRFHLDPGENAQLKIEAYMSNRVGPQRISCTVEHKDGKLWEYTLSTSIYKQYGLSDGGRIDFGRVNADETLKSEFEVTATVASGQILPSNIDFFPALGIQVQKLTSREVEEFNGIKQRIFRLRLVANSGAQQGLNQRTLSIRDSGSVIARVLGADDLVVTWFVVGRHSISPESVFLSDKGETSVQKNVVLKRNDGHALDIKEVKTNGLPIVVTVTKMPNPCMVLLRFSFQEARVIESQWGSVSVLTNGQAPEVIAIPVAIMVTATRTQGESR